jgi:peptide/nickel transport system substrate-binding protein
MRSTALVTVLVLLAACGPQVADVPATARTDPNASARFALATGVTRFDPHRATSSYDNTWLFPVYDRLIHMSPSGAPIPGLAEAWHFGPDGAYLELALRAGVRFHDGAAFDAAAVAANMHHAKTVLGSSVKAELTHIQRVEVVDPLRVRLHLDKPDAALPLILSDRAGMMVSPAALDDPGLDLRGVGAGPFRHVEFRLGDRSVYQRFDGYWRPQDAGVAQLELLLIPDCTTRLNAVRSGQVDGTTIATLQIDQAKRYGLAVQTGVGLEVLHVQLNRTQSEFGDRRVRQALNHAVDRQRIVRAIAFGKGEPSSQDFPTGYLAHDPLAGTDYYDYDPERARSLLADAGLPNGFSFQLIVPNIQSFLPLFEALQYQLAEVGIDAEPWVLEGAQISERFYGKREGDAALVTWGGRPDPSQTIDLLFTPGALPNPGDHSTPGVIRLAALARQEIDTSLRPARLQAASREIVEQALDLVLFLPASTFALRRNVDGMRVWASGNKPEFRGITVRR